LSDVHPMTPVARFDASHYEGIDANLDAKAVAPLVGMSPLFITRVLGKKGTLGIDDVVCLLEQDAFRETFVPRSRVIDYLLRRPEVNLDKLPPVECDSYLVHGDVLSVLKMLPSGSVKCTVTSPPFWGMRAYDEERAVAWADGEVCALGCESTPEGFVRHNIEILHELRSVMQIDGSIWWNIGDSYNTRGRIRGSSREINRSMAGRGEDREYTSSRKRYSAGHSFLKDGDKCAIPSQIAHRAILIGYYLRAEIVWAKQNGLPEPRRSRTARAHETILHLALVRAPEFHHDAYFALSAERGGRNRSREPSRLTDVWSFPTTRGGGAHGAQFPVVLPARCIALSSTPGELVLDPFVGSGTSCAAAINQDRRFIGVDVSAKYLWSARDRISRDIGVEVTVITLNPTNAAAPYSDSYVVFAHAVGGGETGICFQALLNALSNSKEAATALP